MAVGLPDVGRSPPPASGAIGSRALRRRLVHWLVVPSVVFALAAIAWAALAPVRSESREKVFEIPQGTWQRRMAGANTDILPAEIHLTLGLQDVLVLRNRDDVPQMFGPTLMMPGQSFRLPFALASSYPFACTAHASGQMIIVVEPFPATPWARLQWRVREFLEQQPSGHNVAQ